MSTFERKDSVLRVEAVNLHFDGKPVLRDINIDVRDITRPGISQGQVCSLIGRSGIGKTQLFRIIAGLRKPTSGRVLVGPSLEPARPGLVGVVPQSYTLFGHRTVLGNLSLAARMAGSDDPDGRSREMAERFGMSEHLGSYPSRLSGGQRQRVSIMQQILAGNSTILMDEPFSGLDVLMIDRVIELIRTVVSLDDHNTVVIVSHDIETSLSISDCAYVIAREEGLPGATVTRTFDIAGAGLAFNEKVRDLPRFRELVKEVKASL